MTEQSSSFQGERGGDAYDAELLALLKGVSANSGASDRFAGGGDEAEDDTNASAPAPLPDPVPTPVQASPPKKQSAAAAAINKLSRDDPNEIPPWKRKTARTSTRKANGNAVLMDNDDEIVIAMPPPKRSISIPEKEPAPPAANTASLPPTNLNAASKSTFQGDRGGDAHDEELLALLRGISSNSGASDRFAGEDNGNVDGNTSEATTVTASLSKIPSPAKESSPSKIPSPKTSNASTQNNDELPPWKRGKAKGVGAAQTNSSNQSEFEEDTVVLVAAKPKQAATPSDEIVSQPTVAEEQKDSQPLSQQSVMGGEGNFRQTSTFQGDRGGDAHDEELLALLRGVSAKSRSADRFAEDIGNVENRAEAEQPPSPPLPKANSEIEVREEKKELEIPQTNTDNALAPWKRGNIQKTSQPNVDVVIVSKPPKEATEKKAEMPAPSQETVMGGGGNFQQTSNFQGDRGGDAHDEELLALLRGVSAKSSSVDRFSGGDDSEDITITTTTTAPPPPKPAQKSSCRNDNENELPPWKRGKDTKKKVVEDTVDVVVASKPPTATAATTTDQEINLGGAGNFQQTSNFQGDRGGDAHDEELLALLRGVSAKTSSADRFSGGDETDGVAVAEVPQPAPVPSSKPVPTRQSSRDQNSLPPWKRGKVSQTQPKSDEVEVATTEEVVAPLSQETILGRAGNFQQTSNFQGDRGGDAHDEDLLALLRGVSAKSSSTDRFAEGDETEETPALESSSPQKPPLAAPSKVSSLTSSPTSEKKKKRWKVTPPWKKKNKKKESGQQDDSDVIVVASPQKMTQPEASPFVVVEPSSNDVAVEGEAPVEGGRGNFKQGPSTFQGDRGGDAHDEELLALLRGASSSNSSDRFADTVEAAPAPMLAAEAPQIEAPIDRGRGNFQSAPSNFQGERGGDAHDEELLALLRGASSSKASDRFAEAGDTTYNAKDEVAPAAPVPEKSSTDETIVQGGRGNFQQGSTFQGDRGGDAHDEELLALLRGVSSSNASGGTDRFAEASEAAAPPPPKLAAPKPLQQKPMQSSSQFPSTSSSSVPTPFPTGDAPEEIVVTLDDLPGAFTDKDWKLRKTSYQVLSDSIAERTKIGEAPGSIKANTIVPGLDELIPNLFAEKNAIALEAAMQAGTEYANGCIGGASEEQAIAMMNALFKGNGLSSPRPTSAKAATALVLKIMEVGSTAASLKSSAAMLVEKGLPAKKPKVVLLSASLILEAIHSFGAVHLPISSIASALPKVLTHTNKKIRDIGMEIVAELCRSFGSKDPLEGVIGKMQKAQAKDLDTLLAKRADPIPTKIGLRCLSGGAKGGGATCAADIFTALKTGNEELEKERFAKRPAVKLMEEISKTAYVSELQEAKWSKKVGALDMVLTCGGEKPYKLAQPSSSNNYSILISDMKGLLKHTHFAVVSKAMGVLGMLAQGVGEKLYSNLRPLLPKLLQLSKDKKLTKAVSECLDACFGNVLSYEHLLDSDSSITTATNESKEKNALARTSALDYLDRCVTRGESAGPRGSLTPTNAKACAKLASQKLGDSDANVRKAALKILTSLQKIESDGVQSAVNNVVEELQQSNPRAYKTLSKTAVKSSIPKATPSGLKKSGVSGSVVATPRARNVPSSRAPMVSKTALPLATPVNSKPSIGNSSQAIDSADGEIPSYEESLTHCGTMGIPRWDEPEGEEDEVGVLDGIQSTKWQSRHAAIKELVGFVSTSPPFSDRGELEKFSNCLLIFVKEHTKKFKESNMNVARCILELFLAVCEHHERSQYRIAKWATADGTALAVEKIVDKKLSSLSKKLLLSFCIVHPPQVVITSACACAEKLRSPLAHEEFLVWIKTFCNGFGAASIGSGVQETVAFLISECGHKNIKVKRAASATIGLIHVHLGPTIKAVSLSSIKNPSLRDEIEKTFQENPFDSSLSSKEWPSSYILSNSENGTENGGASAGSGMDIELPMMDLITELPSDCISRMGSKDGKTSWKARKGALEDVEKALKSNRGLLDTSILKPLMDLLRAMRERLSDSQSNLKPLAARLIGLLLGSVEGEAQGKLGKLVYGPIMNAAMNDKRKVMNDAAIEALKKGISIPEIKGEGLNENSLEQFVIALTAQLDGSEFKSVGIAGILTLTKAFAPKLPDLDKISSQRGETVGGRFSKVLVNALSSSKAEIRSAAESLLSECITNNVFSMQTAKKCMGRMVPAKQRTIGMILAKISSSSSASSSARAIVEASPIKPPRVSSSRAPPVEPQSKSMERSAIQKPKSTQRTAGPKSRLGTNSKPSVNHDDEEPTDDNASNPLVVHANPNGIQKSRAAMRSVTWPEYPEEPSGTPLYNGLKKAWSHIIPLNSTKKLFPDKGIRNQSDVNDAFDILRQAIKMDKEDQGCVVVEQLHFILRWSVYVMGCKESAVGLTGLLDMLSDLISYLNGRTHEFSDPEVSLFVPFLYEKASVAKGRFKDAYMDLIRSIKADNLISDKRLGPLVCVPLIENSSHAKARLLACQTCHHCVEVIGLSGIGKKGVLVAAKAFSTDKLPENRAAFLDLMALLVSKMHNDIDRLSKICGSSLTLKAKSLIEEHMRKAQTPSKTPQEKTPTPRKAARSSRPSQLSPPTKLSFSPKREFVAPSVFEDELPALDLRRVLRERESPSTTPTKVSGLRPPSFSSTQVVSISSSYSSHLASSSGESDRSEALQSGASGESLPKNISSPLGAAASLRARLLKIREKNNLVTLPTKPSETIDIPMTTSIAARSNIQHTEDYTDASMNLEDSILSEVLDSEPVLDFFLETIRKLLEKSHKIFEDDEDLLSSTAVLKNIHAAVSKQATLAVMISPIDVENLRAEIRERASEVVGILTQLIRFGFHCHPDTLSAGMSVPLLSVNLASLMAIFRSKDLATLVNVDDLTILIKEAGTALLDPRLAQSTKQGDVILAQIDEAISTQMVRAINKLAVQAATGAARENSIQALIRLQDQLSSNSNLGDDLQFNGRLSRVVTKLSTRVIKAEESASHPFSSSSMDMETVLCVMEDTLNACRNAQQPEGATTTKHIVKSVITAILKARRECTSIRQEMNDLEIDPHKSELGELVDSIASDLGMISAKPPLTTSENNDVTSLVSAVVSAAQGPARTAAIDALKSYRSIHGDKELMTHLEDVSPAFRSYLVKELSENSNHLSQQRTSTDAMSERIKKLRSKLNATEGSLSKGEPSQAPSISIPPSKTLDNQQRMKNLRQKLNATHAAPPIIASAYPPPSTLQPNAGEKKNDHTTTSDHSGRSSMRSVSDEDPSSNAAVNAFRERLAAAKEKQATNKSSSSELASPMPTTSASSRAAALRARLQAVKMQTQL